MAPVQRPLHAAIPHLTSRTGTDLRLGHTNDVVCQRCLGPTRELLVFLLSPHRPHGDSPTWARREVRELRYEQTPHRSTAESLSVDFGSASRRSLAPDILSG